MSTPVRLSLEALREEAEERFGAARAAELNTVLEQLARDIAAVVQCSPGEDDEPE